MPNARRSGLIEAAEVLKGVNGISFNFFDEGDVVRHVLVQRIIRAYDEQKVRAENQLSLELGSNNGARQNGEAAALPAPEAEPEEYRYSNEG